MALLEGLLIGEENDDYLPTIVKMPVSPLLKFLEPLENDSGFRGTSTCSSYEGRQSSFNDAKVVRLSKFSLDNHLEMTDSSSCTASFTSDVTTSEGGSSRSAVR